MTALREEIIEYVESIPEEKLPALKSILLILSTESTTVLEKLTDEDLSDEEREAFIKAELEFKCGETHDFEELLAEQGIAM